MRFKQFIYTSYKKYRAEELGLNSGYDVFAKTEGISEEEGEELASYFLNYVVPADPRLDDLDHIVENVKKYAPKQRAYLKLKNDKYCWCQVSLVPFDFTGRYNSIYFHAVLAEDDPDFNPAEFFDNFEFRSDLTDDEFHARVAPPRLSEGSMDKSSMRRLPANVKLSKDVCERLLTCILYSVRTQKPLFLNCKTEQAYDIIKSALSLLPLPIAKRVYFSTYSSDDREDGKIYRVAHMGKDFNYEARLTNDYVIIADLTENKFSPHVPEDPFISRLTDYLYSNGAEAEKFAVFYETYTGGNVDFDAVALINAYDFIYTDAFKKFDMLTMQSVIADPYVSTVTPNLRAARYEEYIKSNRLSVQERGSLLAEVYRCIKDRKILLDYTGELLNETACGRLTLADSEELLKRTFNSDLKTVVLGDLQAYGNLLSSNIFNDTIYSLVIALLTSAEKVDRAKAEYLYDLLYKCMAAKNDLSVLTDKLLPSLAESGYFTACAKKIFNTNVGKGAAFWLGYINGCGNDRVRDILLSNVLDYLGDDVRLQQLVLAIERNNLNTILGLLRELDKKGLASDKIFAVIKKILTIECKNNPSSISAVNILKLYDVMTFNRVDELYDIVVGVLPEQTAEEVFIKLAKEYNDEYIKSLSKGKYAAFGESIIANSINSASEFINRYVKNYYLKGIYANSCNSIIDKITFADDTERWYFYADVFKEVAGSRNELVQQAYSYLNSKLCEVSHGDRKKMDKAIAMICENTGKPSEILEFFRDLAAFDGNFKKALSLESFIIKIRDKNGKAFEVALKYYYDCLIYTSLTVVKKKKKSELLVEVYANNLAENQLKYIWKTYFERDKKAQLLYMLDLLRTDSVSGDDRCALLAYFYNNADEKTVAKLDKLVSKQKDANKQKDERLANSVLKYREE